ncbi:MAG: hypothetical protein ACYCW6_16210 [Candidatus Xenobia bacterium]
MARLPKHAHLTGAPVYLGRKAVMTVYGISKFDATRKAQTVQDRLDQAMKWGIPDSKVSLTRIHRVYTVVWGGHVIATADGLQARGNHSHEPQLGRLWVHNIQRAVHAQLFTLSEHSVLMAVGSTHSVAIQGGLSGTTTAKVAGTGFTATVDAKQLVLKATAPGTGVVTLTRNHYQIPLRVMVKQAAGVLPTQVSCVVTGNPANREVLTDALMYALRGAVKVAPGASIYMKGDPKMADSLAPDKDLVARVPLSLEGANLLTVAHTVKVQVHNRPVAIQDASLLMVSNRPETVQTNGVLFTGTFGPGHAARLIYDHQNGSTHPRQLSVTLTNRSDKPADIFMLTVPGQPDPNGSSATEKAVAHYLERAANPAGVVVTLPPRTGWQILQQQMPPNTHVAGVCHFQVLSNQEIEVSVQARESGVPLAVASRTIVEAPPDPDRSHPRGVFVSPDLSLGQIYTAGTPDAHLDLAADKKWLEQGGETDSGNLGALYHISLKLSNPGTAARTVALVYTPNSDNNVRACMLLDGKLKETAIIMPHGEEVLNTYNLAAGETRSVNVTFLPAPGMTAACAFVLRTYAPVVPVVAPVVVPSPDSSPSPGSTASPTGTPSPSGSPDTTATPVGPASPSGGTP